MDYPVTLPNGQILAGEHPIVVIGPNGSGKTRQTRNINATVPIEFVNALRNTRVAPELPAMGMETARNQFRAQRDQARMAHWELTSEFDYMLSELLAQKSMAAIEFTRRYELDPATAGQPVTTPLGQVERLWGNVFPGRELHWQDWKPLIKNSASGAEIQYTGNQMSDGEKAALFLAGRVFSADPCILVVDEPETHFHSLLAVRLWNALEDARPDIRFVYVTHDLTFALSRREPQFVLASPTGGLRVIDVDSSLPTDVANALLGSASLSFYASRVVFCEGDDSSIDNRLYSAWFNGPDTVVRPVGSCQRVIRCVDAVGASGIAQSLTAIGIVDGDYHPEAFKAALPTNVSALKVHEVESLLCLPAVVAAVCEHVSQDFDQEKYRATVAGTVRDDQRSQIIVRRWKARLQPDLNGLVSAVGIEHKPIDDLEAELPGVFDSSTWPFSPAAMLQDERRMVEAIVPDGAIERLLAVLPGKQVLALAARTCGINLDTYVKLILDALHGDAALEVLSTKVEQALLAYLPSRHVSVAIPTS